VAHLCISGLSKRFPPRVRGAAHAEALRGLDLDVNDGELLVLVGPSGCGKSTALRLIAGLEEPSAGRIELDGRELSDTPPQDRDVAMVFQGYALYPHLTVRENMAFPLKMRGASKKAIVSRVAEIADLLGLGDKLERLPAELSGGEQQRVAMGRAIVRAPKVFLFDEPLSHLDAKLRAELRVELAGLVRKLGVTSIYVTHDQAEAMTMGDRIAVMRAGELMQIATPRSVYEDPDHAFVAAFVGSPEMNLVAVERSGSKVSGSGFALDGAPSWLPQGQLHAAFRPEHAALDGERPGAASIHAVVRAVEPHGASTYVYLDAERTPLRLRLAGFGGPVAGDEVAIAVPAERLLWFDPESGSRLRPPA
jgi:multiple sugar transport system ATP-binding protein